MSDKRKTASKSTSPVRPDQSAARGSSRTAAPASPKTAGGIDISSLIVIGVVVLAVIAAAFFVYRGSMLKAELVQAREDTQKQHTEMQSQIDAANSKVRESAGQLTQLQAQVGSAKAEAASAKANAEKASRQVAALKTELEQANHQTALANANAKRAAAEAARWRAQLQAQTRAQAQPQPATPAPAKPAPPTPPAPVKHAAPTLKPLPLSVTFKEDPQFQGVTLALQNTSTASLSLTVRLASPGSKATVVQLKPDAAQEIPWLGDRLLASGDKIEIQSAGYAPVVKTAP